MVVCKNRAIPGNVPATTRLPRLVDWLATGRQRRRTAWFVRANGQIEAKL
jgi:hypothetical protein